MTKTTGPEPARVAGAAPDTPTAATEDAAGHPAGAAGARAAGGPATGSGSGVPGARAAAGAGAAAGSATARASARPAAAEAAAGAPRAGATTGARAAGAVATGPAAGASGAAAAEPAVGALDFRAAAALPRASTGDKAEKVAWLMSHGFPVTDGFVVLPATLAELGGGAYSAPGGGAYPALDGGGAYSAPGGGGAYPAPGGGGAYPVVDAALRSLADRAGVGFGGPGGLTVSVRPSFLADAPGQGFRYLEIGSATGVRAGGEPDDALRATAHLGRVRARLALRLPAPWNSGARLDLAAALVASGGDDPAAGDRAAVVQVMAPFRHRPRSGRGIALSADPVTGAAGLTGEFSPGDAPREAAPAALDLLRRAHPDCHAELGTALTGLRKLLGHHVEVEFVVSSGRLFLFQVREAALSRLARAEPPPPQQPGGGGTVLAHGTPVSPGTCRAPLHRFTRTGTGSATETGPAAAPHGIVVVDEISVLQPADFPGIRGVIALRGSTYGHAASRLCRMAVPAVIVTDTTDATGGTAADSLAALEGAPVFLDAYRGTVTAG